MNHKDAKNAKDLFIYLIGDTDQANHQALAGNLFSFVISLSSVQHIEIQSIYVSVNSIIVGNC
jgi:hypothetical protein